MRAAPGVFTWPGILSGEPNRVSVLLPPSCSWHKFLRCLLTVFPFLEWMCLYRFKDWLLGDLLAGLSVGLVQVPQGKGNPQPSYQSWSPRPQRLPGASSCAGWTEGKHLLSPFLPLIPRSLPPPGGSKRSDWVEPHEHFPQDLLSSLLVISCPWVVSHSWWQQIWGGVNFP